MRLQSSDVRDEFFCFTKEFILLPTPSLLSIHPIPYKEHIDIKVSICPNV